MSTRTKLFAAALSTALIWLPPTFAPAETVNDVTGLNPIEAARVILPRSDADVAAAIRDSDTPVCIGGGRYSMGGQTATPGCLHLDMRGMNAILDIDREHKRITVQSGATWQQIIDAIDPLELSLRIMQTYANFTVGGSLSVNAHGRYVGEGPLVRAVESIRLVLADGSVHDASRDQNPELFWSAIGGYGGIGVITQATLSLTDNGPLRRVAERMPLADYLEYFRSQVRSSGEAVFHNADIYPPDYSELTAVTWFRTDAPLTLNERLRPRRPPSAFQLGLLYTITDLPFGHWLRANLYDPLIYRDEVVALRNYEASYDVIELEPESRAASTYVLQEYFVPVDALAEFVPLMRDVFARREVRIANVSIRHANPDPGTLLAWAPTEVFSLVIYYKQDVGDEAWTEAGVWTRELIDAVLSVEGRYYLPYQIHASGSQFHQAYPRAGEFLALKAKVDPKYRFRNRLWDRYYPASP